MKYPAYKMVVGPDRPYSGLWVPPPGGLLFLIKSGMLYFYDIKFCFPLTLEGHFLNASLRDSRLASPAYYFKHKEVWKPVNPGSCIDEFKRVRDNIDGYYKVFVYENGKLHIRSEGKSHLIRWRRISETELRILLNFS